MGRFADWLEQKILSLLSVKVEVSYVPSSGFPNQIFEIPVWRLSRAKKVLHKFQAKFKNNTYRLCPDAYFQITEHLSDLMVP